MIVLSIDDLCNVHKFLLDNYALMLDIVYTFNTPLQSKLFSRFKIVTCGGEFLNSVGRDCPTPTVQLAVMTDHPVLAVCIG